MKLINLCAMLFRIGTRPWKWQRVDNENGGCWELVHDNALHPTNIFALGETLIVQAQAIACLHPAILNEISAVSSLDAEALDRVRSILLSMRQIRTLVYQNKVQAIYPSLKYAISELAKLEILLQRVSWFATEAEFSEWESFIEPGPTEED